MVVNANAVSRKLTVDKKPMMVAENGSRVMFRLVVPFADLGENSRSNTIRGNKTESL